MEIVLLVGLLLGAILFIFIITSRCKHDWIYDKELVEAYKHQFNSRLDYTRTFKSYHCDKCKKQKREYI